MLPSSSARIGSVWISPGCVTMWRTAVTTVMNLDAVRSLPVFFLYSFNKHINALLICALYTNPTVMPASVMRLMSSSEMDCLYHLRA